MKIENKIMNTKNNENCKKIFNKIFENNKNTEPYLKQMLLKDFQDNKIYRVPINKNLLFNIINENINNNFKIYYSFDKTDNVLYKIFKDNDNNNIITAYKKQFDIEYNFIISNKSCLNYYLKLNNIKQLTYDEKHILKSIKNTHVGLTPYERGEDNIVYIINKIEKENKKNLSNNKKRINKKILDYQKKQLKKLINTPDQEDNILDNQKYTLKDYENYYNENYYYDLFNYDKKVKIKYTQKTYKKYEN